MPYSFVGSSTGIVAGSNSSYQVGSTIFQSSFTEGNVKLGTTIGVNLGQNNTFLGQKCGDAISTGQLNVFIGADTGRLVTTGIRNTLVGSVAGNNMTSGSYNTMLGDRAGQGCISGSYNTFVGSDCGITCTGSDNSFFGVQAGKATTTGGSNVFFGELSGFSNTVGNNNTFVGLFAGRYSVSGGNNTFVGAYAGSADTTFISGNACTFIGCNIAPGANLSNTVIIADGDGAKFIVADNSNLRTLKPIQPPSYTVAALPSAALSGVGAMCYATNGRKGGEAAAAGTGTPVYSNGTIWLCYYNNLQVTA